jgi:hypothetical protein
LFDCVGPRKRVYCSLQAYCVFNVPTFTARRLHVTTTLEILAAKSGTCLGEKRPVIWPKVGIFYMPQIYDMGQTALLPSEGSRAEDVWALKKPKASAGFEPATLGTKGQHTTPRPPKPLTLKYLITYI